MRKLVLELAILSKKDHLDSPVDPDVSANESAQCSSILPRVRVSCEAWGVRCPHASHTIASTLSRKSLANMAALSAAKKKECQHSTLDAKRATPYH